MKLFNFCMFLLLITAFVLIGSCQLLGQGGDRIEGVWRSDKHKTLAENRDKLDGLTLAQMRFLESSLGRMHYVFSGSDQFAIFGEATSSLGVDDIRALVGGGGARDGVFVVYNSFRVLSESESSLVLELRGGPPTRLTFIHDGACFSVGMGAGWNGVKEVFCRMEE